jgi:hypothetical protein
VQFDAGTTSTGRRSTHDLEILLAYHIDIVVAGRLYAPEAMLKNFTALQLSLDPESVVSPMEDLVATRLVSSFSYGLATRRSPQD